MNTVRNTSRSNKLTTVTAVVSMILLFAACSRKIAFNTSTVVPAAEGSVKVKKDYNNNYNIDLNVTRLADPKRLNPPKNYYVVWMETEQNGTKNLGRLNTSSGLFSGKLRSSLKTVTGFKPTSFFITAEDEISPSYPSGQIVLRTNSF